MDKVSAEDIDQIIEVHYKVFKSKSSFNKNDIQSSSIELCYLISGSHNHATKKLNYKQIQDLLNLIVKVEQKSE